MSSTLSFQAPSRAACAPRAESRGPDLHHAFADLNRAALRVIRTLELWSARRAQRRALLSLPNYLVKDIGLTQADVDGEVQKPFWR